MRKMRLTEAINLIEQMGAGWAVRRAGYALRGRAGWLERRMPAHADWSAFAWETIAPKLSRRRVRGQLERAAQRFVIRPAWRLAYQKLLGRLLSVEAQQKLIAQAHGIRRGEFEFFSHLNLKLGFPPHWHRHPATQEDWDADAHWSRLDDMGDADVKWLWEMGRFGAAYTLLRAYWLTGDDTHAETFWQLAESWRADNLPNCGAHWMCGQEAAIRVLALTFALFAFLDAPATTDERLVMLVEMLAAHGARIAANIGYALAQKNNHGVNEALGLFLLGTIFPFLAEAKNWAAQGRELLEREAVRQIYDDGSYVQHSVNYHRLVLQSYAVALRVGELNKTPFTWATRERFAKAARWLWQMTDEHTGGAPNYGSNDGAVLMRLDAGEFGDYRPTLALAFWQSERRRVLPAGGWDEFLLWIGGAEALQAEITPLPRSDLNAYRGGYYTLRGTETWAFVRCVERYRDRPAQADLLNVDIWWRGHNLVGDAGTYSYSSAPPWDNPLAHTRAHNCLTIEGRDQMQRGARFTWFYWTRGRVVRQWEDAERRIQLFEGEHYGYQREFGATHRRALMLVDNYAWIVVDDLHGSGALRVSAQWLFPQSRVWARGVESMILQTPVGNCRVQFFSFEAENPNESCGGTELPFAECSQLKLVRASRNTAYGWVSPRYMDKQPAPAALVLDECFLPLRRVTVIALNEAVEVQHLTAREIHLNIPGDKLRVEWQNFPYGAKTSLVKRARFDSDLTG